MDTENVVYLHNRVLLSYYKQWIHVILRQMDEARKYHPEWETQTQNNTHGMHSLISGYYPQNSE